jgi:BA14K-like protein
LHSLTLKAAVLAIAMGALGSVPAAAAVAPAPSANPGKSSMIRVAAMGTLGANGQSLAKSPVELAQRRGRGFRGGRNFRGRAWRGGRGWRGGRHYGRRWRGGRRWYGWRGGRRWYGGRWIGPAIVAGTAALIIGGSIAESRASYGDRWERCADRFRSFRWSDGTYQPYGDNPRRLCPYLRR